MQREQWLKGKQGVAGDQGSAGTQGETGSHGLELISYYDDTNADLKVAHCSNQFCPPIFQEKIGVFAKLTILSNERNKLT